MTTTLVFALGVPGLPSVAFRRGWLPGGIALVACCAAVAGVAAPPAPVMVEAEKAVKPPAVVHRDERASDGRVAVGMLADKGGKLVEHGAPLPGGDSDVTVWMEPKPLTLMHSLAVSIQAGSEQQTLGAIAFDPQGGLPAVHVPVHPCRRERNRPRLGHCQQRLRRHAA